MISVDEAKELVSRHSQPLASLLTPLSHCVNAVLAEDIFSPLHFPSYPQSAMDGYALRFDDMVPGQPLKTVGEVQAGSGSTPGFAANTAVRIFTGAPVPEGYDTVVMQEHTSRKDELLYIHSTSLSRGMNVRQKGSEIGEGDLALAKGTTLTAGAIGFLAGLGLTKVPVYKKPSIGILVTGKELHQPGTSLPFGKVYESNSVMLSAALQQMQFAPPEVCQVDDDPELTAREISNLLEKSDLLLITGGVSVGDYDYVAGALAKCGVATVFHKVKQKPGKPLLFGKKGRQLVFGLPGNPSSVLSCFYQYVSIALQNLCGRSSPFLLTMQQPLASDFSKAAGLTHFLKGISSGHSVTILPAQESFRLSSFAIANCLVQIPEEVSTLQAKDLVTIYILPR